MPEVLTVVLTKASTSSRSSVIGKHCPHLQEGRGSSSKENEGGG
jgi:hypothetical protein